MPTSDPGEKRAFANAQTHRAEQIVALAKSIHEQTGYMLSRAREGQYVLADSNARRAAADIEELRLFISAFKALDDMRFIAAEPEEG